MPIELNTPRAKELQDAIQRQLAVRGWSSETDPVMAEFITIMIINSKSSDQITAELTELIGDEYDDEFTTWLFAEAADEAPPVVTAPAPVATPEVQSEDLAALSKPIPTGPRANSSPISAPAKRSRSPADNGAPSRKAPRTSDLPDRPRAMQDSNTAAPSSQGPPPNPRQNGSQGGGGRSLLDRVGPAPRFPQQQHRPPPNMPVNVHQAPQHQMMFDPVQAQIEAVTAASNGMMMPFMNPGMMPIDPSQMQMQELMQNQVMMMAHMQQMMNQLGAQAVNIQNNQVGGFQGPNHPNVGGPNTRGRGRGGPNRGTGRGGGFQSRQTPNGDSAEAPEPENPSGSSTTVPQSAPLQAVASPLPSHPSSAPAYTSLDRPQTPTLCKYATACTNPACRYSHPSPAATAESGLVLSTEACENGSKCADKDCTKSHPSPAVLDPNATPHVTKTTPHHPAPYPKSPAVRFNPYAKPFVPASSPIPCRFGVNCTKATCTFQHPPGRATLPGDFHRGINSNDPTVRVLDPGKEKSKSRVLAAGAALANRYNKSVTFNKPKPSAPTATTPEVASPASATGDVGAVEAAVPAEVNSTELSPAETPATAA